jgi:protein-S-isoprenylcysteine O-methyltransferase Ste14
MRHSMPNSAITPSLWPKFLYALCLLLGIGLIVWQFFTFKEVVQGHTAKAQRTSRSAGWSGQPVGTTPQRDASDNPALTQVQHSTR